MNTTYNFIYTIITPIICFNAFCSSVSIAQSGPEIMTRIVDQYRKAKNIELTLNITTSFKDEAPSRFRNIQLMATDSHDIYLHTTESDLERLIHELTFTKFKSDARGHYHEMSFSNQKEDSVNLGMAYLLARGGLIFNFFQNLFYKGYPPFSTQKINTLKDFTCWVKQEDTIIQAKEYYQLSMLDTIFFTPTALDFFTKTQNIVRDSFKLKRKPPTIGKFTVYYYSILVEKNSYVIHKINFKMKTESGSNRLDTGMVKVVLDQPLLSFYNKLVDIRGK